MTCVTKSSSDCGSVTASNSDADGGHEVGSRFEKWLLMPFDSIVTARSKTPVSELVESNKASIASPMSVLAENTSSLLQAARGNQNCNRIPKCLTILSFTLCVW